MARLTAPCHLFQGGRGDRAAPECAQHVPGEHDGVQALSAHVPDDYPDAMPGGDDLIEITADRGLAGRRAVARSDADPGHLRGQRREQRQLRGLRDGGHPGQALLAPTAYARHHDRHRADNAGRRNPGPVGPIPEETVPPPCRDSQRRRGAREDGRAAFVSDGGHDQRRHAEQRGHDDARHHLERAAKKQPQARRGHCHVPGRRMRPHLHSRSPAGTSCMASPTTSPSSRPGSEHPVAGALAARAGRTMTATATSLSLPEPSTQHER